jgi:hypothetical protein
MHAVPHIQAPPTPRGSCRLCLPPLLRHATQPLQQRLHRHRGRAVDGHAAWLVPGGTEESRSTQIASVCSGPAVTLRAAEIFWRTSGLHRREGRQAGKSDSGRAAHGQQFKFSRSACLTLLPSQADWQRQDSMQVHPEWAHLVGRRLRSIACSSRGCGGLQALPCMYARYAPS